MWGLQDLKCGWKQPGPTLGTKIILCLENMLQKCDYYPYCAKNVPDSSQIRKHHASCPDKPAIQGVGPAAGCMGIPHQEQGAARPWDRQIPSQGEPAGVGRAQQDPRLEISSLQILLQAIEKDHNSLFLY